MSKKCSCLTIVNVCKKLKDKKCEDLIRKLDEIGKSNLPESEKEKLYKQVEKEFFEYFQQKARELGQEFVKIVFDSDEETKNKKY